MSEMELSWRAARSAWAHVCQYVVAPIEDGEQDEREDGRGAGAACSRRDQLVGSPGWR